MQKILVLGAGKSSWFLLEHLSKLSVKNNWHITACDKDKQTLESHTGYLLKVTALELDVENQDLLAKLVESSDLIVSLLPPLLHPKIARICLRYNKHLATASYVSEEMHGLHDEAKSKGLIFINEMGLDPGIDHMSALQMLDGIRNLGGEIVSFESYCGGLISKEDCLNNPWNYKFSWNPMNVILAGQGGMSVFRIDGQDRCIPWHKLFANAKKIEIPELDPMEYYANRDSLGYEKIYGLHTAATLIRGTLRRTGFSDAWQVLVDLGYTDNNSLLHRSVNSINDLTTMLTGCKSNIKLSEWLCQNHLISEEQVQMFDFMDLQSEKKIVSEPVTSAVLLRLHLEEKWKLDPQDKDEVIMYHRISYTLNERTYVKSAVMQMKGSDSLHTAMAQTVGFPLAVAVELILGGEIEEKGVCIPVTPEWYNKVLPKLHQLGIVFKEYGA